MSGEFPTYRPVEWGVSSVPAQETPHSTGVSGASEGSSRGRGTVRGRRCPQGPARRGQAHRQSRRPGLARRPGASCRYGDRAALVRAADGCGCSRRTASDLCRDTPSAGGPDSARGGRAWNDPGRSGLGGHVRSLATGAPRRLRHAQRAAAVADTRWVRARGGQRGCGRPDGGLVRAQCGIRGWAQPGPADCRGNCAPRWPAYHASRPAGGSGDPARRRHDLPLRSAPRGRHQVASPDDSVSDLVVLGPPSPRRRRRRCPGQCRSGRLDRSGRDVG